MQLANEIALTAREKDTLRGKKFESHNFYLGAEQHLSPPYNARQQRRLLIVLSINAPFFAFNLDLIFIIWYVNPQTHNRATIQSSTSLPLELQLIGVLTRRHFPLVQFFGISSTCPSKVPCGNGKIPRLLGKRKSLR
jgi:hypothetical protein